MLHSVFHPGGNEKESYKNFLEWLKRVQIEKGISCERMPKGAVTGKDVIGCLHHLTADEADEFVAYISVKMMFWSAHCTMNRISTGSMLKISACGKGQLAMVAVPLGPFQD